MNLPGSETAGNITPLQVADWLRLFIEPGQVSELRALEVVEGRYRTPVIAGFYDHEHLDEMAAAALKLSPRAKGVYFVLNPLKPQILCRRANRVDKAGTGDLAGDGHVERRKFLLVDVDPVRLDGISATDEEKEAARTVMKRLVDYLRSVGWPEPIFADSGNGYHALPYIDLPAADGDLVKGVLRALAQKFDTDLAKIDQKVFNPARIVKVYGTISRKGDPTDERPHRTSAVLQVPENRVPVPKDLLEAIAAEFQEPPKPLKAPTTSPTRLDRSQIVNRARAYINKMPPAVAGNNGHNQTFEVACKLILGFDLSQDEAYPIMLDYSARCQPPWSENELLHKLADADKDSAERGYLLNGDRHHGSQISGPHATHSDDAMRDEGPEHLHGDAWEQGQPPQDHYQEPSPSPRTTSGFSLDALDSQTFADSEFKQEWDIVGALVKGQLAALAGALKTLKTSTGIDMAVSLGSGTPFLGHFAVPIPRPVLFLSAESGWPVLRSTAKRVCEARGISLADSNVFWGTKLPQFTEPAHMRALAAFIKEHEVGM